MEASPNVLIKIINWYYPLAIIFFFDSQVFYDMEVKTTIAVWYITKYNDHIENYLKGRLILLSFLH